MAQQSHESKGKSAGAMKVFAADGQELSSKVHRIVIGNLDKGIVDETEHDAQALRGGKASMRRSDNSSKEITCTGGDCGDSYTSGDTDF